MLTGMLAVRNLVLGERNDLWSVNTEQEYQEEIRRAATTPEAVATLLGGALAPGFAKLDWLAFGLALGTVAGSTLFVATSSSG
jgi:hypothetical protein